MVPSARFDLAPADDDARWEHSEDGRLALSGQHRRLAQATGRLGLDKERAGVKGPDTVGPGSHRLAALRLANDVRRERAALKRRIAEGGLSAAEVLLDPSPVAAGCSLVDLLMSQRKWGRVKVSKFLARNQIAASKRISDLTDRQRQLLAAQLRRSG
jgi:hypothetical protein